jgi:hypothetical protein
MDDFDWMADHALLVDFWEPDSWWFTVDFGRFIRASSRWTLEGAGGTLLSATQAPPRTVLARVRQILRGTHIAHAGIRQGTADLVLRLHPNMRLEFSGSGAPGQHWEVRGPHSHFVVAHSDARIYGM